MQNVRRGSSTLLVSFILIIFCSIATDTTAQDFNNPEAVFLESQGYQLKTKHVMAWMFYNIQMGVLPSEPSEAQMEPIMIQVAEQFMMAPALTLQSINAVAPVNEVAGTNGNTNQQTNGQQEQELQQNSQRSNYAAGPTPNQHSAFDMKATWDRLSPGNQFDFNSAQAHQVKHALAGSTMKQSSNSYSAPSYGGAMGGYTESSLTIHFCPDGTFAWENAGGVSVGNDQIGGYDYGSDQVTGNWDVATAGSYTMITLYSQHPEMMQLGMQGLAPMLIKSIGADYVGITNAEVKGGEDLYRLTPGGARCY